MRFTDFYVSQPVCSASRASLLTGCYPNRLGISGALAPSARHGLDPEETTIAEIVKPLGYATACFGKWHLGDERAYQPGRRGFDEAFIHEMKRIVLDDLDASRELELGRWRARPRAYRIMENACNLLTPIL